MLLMQNKKLKKQKQQKNKNKSKRERVVKNMLPFFMSTVVKLTDSNFPVNQTTHAHS